MTATILFQDDFATNGPLNSNNWDYNHWTQNNNSSFLGLTQMRQSLPVALNGMARIELDTWNPATGQGYSASFLGSEAITKAAFSLPSNGEGIAFEGKFKFEGTQGGMIAGFFSFQNFPIGQGQALHDEIDDEILTTNLQELSTNIWKHSDDNINPLSVPLPSGVSFGEFHTYRMEWFADHVSWYIDTKLVRTVTHDIPTTPQQLHMNLWGVPTGWGPSPGDPSGPPIGDPSFVPAQTASQNASYFFDVTGVKVEQLSAPSGLTAQNGAASQPSGLNVSNDIYTTLENHALAVASAASVLSNDSSSAPMHASLTSGPSHGTLSFAADGTFNYNPNNGFSGIDSFTYQTADDSGAIGSSSVQIDVAPTKVGATGATLDFAALAPGEQVAAIYSGLLGRGADLVGFIYWTGQQYAGSAQKGSLSSIIKIANDFAVGSEAKALYPLLGSPTGASDAQIGAFLDKLYKNLFGHSVDIAGQSYWTSQFKQVSAAGQPLGSLVVAIINGAQDGDIVALLNKTQVNLEFVNQQNSLHTTWSSTDQGAAATLVAAVTADPHTALVGIKQAASLVLADFDQQGN